MKDYIILHSHEGVLPPGVNWHYFIPRTGQVYQLLPLNRYARHCMGKNRRSIAVCFEGAFNKSNELTLAQLKNGRELLRVLIRRYPDSRVLPHCAFVPVDCPGEYFPIGKLVNIES